MADDLSRPASANPFAASTAAHPRLASMTAATALALAAILSAFAIRRTAELLNLRAAQGEAPPDLADLYEPSRYRRSQQYTRARGRLGLVAATVHLAALLVFWGLGGFAWIDAVMRSLGASSVATGVAVIGALAGASALLGLPFSVVATFGVEARYGFNTTTVRTFLLDGAKGVLLSLVIGAPLLAGLLWVLEVAGPSAWLVCWLLVTAVSLLLQVVAPTWIAPLFHRFTPLPEGELRSAIEAFAAGAAFPIDDVYVVDGSRRSRKANAFFMGFGPRKRIALFDTLLEEHPTEEIVAVLAHEIGHYKRGHLRRGLLLGTLQIGLWFLLLSVALGTPWIPRAFGFESASVYAGLISFALLASPLDLVLSTVLRMLSRRHEYEADAFARSAGVGAPLCAGLKRLSAESLNNLTPHPVHTFLFATHPPLRERLAALRAD